LRSVADNIQYIIDPRILFSPNMEETGYLAARLLPVEIVLYYTGLLVLYRVVSPTQPRFRFYVYWVFLLASIPALITWQSNSMRFGVVLLILPLWSAAGAVWIARKFEKRGVRPPVFYGALSVATGASVAFVAYMYLMSPLANGQRSTNVLVQLGARIGEWSPRFDRIYVVDSPYYAGLHVAAFGRVHPRDFQRTRRIEVDSDGWDYVREFGKYRFIKPHELAALRTHDASLETRLFASRNAPVGSITLDSVAWANDRYVLWTIPKR
jgi:8-oxo-dGTP pyrophosphatase MutT (NUDIX family)